MMNLRMRETTWSHPHNVLLPQLDLLDGLDHVEGEGDGAGDATRHSTTDKVDHEAVVLDTETVQIMFVSDGHVSPQIVPAGLVQRPIEGGERNITK